MKKNLLFPAMLALCLLGNFRAQAQATMQIVHNCGDTLLNKMDVYVNGSLAFDDFEYRTATTFLSLPSGVAINLGLAFKGSISANDTIRNVQITLTAGERYVAFINGVFHVNKYAPNPNNQGTGLKIEVVSGVRATAINGNEIDLLAFHGCTDLIKYDVRMQPNTLVADDLKFTNFSSYFSLLAAPAQVFNITDAVFANNIFYSHVADLSPYAGGTGVVYTSGFVDPSLNENGAPYGLFMVLSNGNIVELPQLQKARLQFIHNSADSLFQNIDVWINGVKKVNNIRIHEASEYMDVAAGIPLNIGIADNSSTSVTDTIRNYTFTLDSAKSYVIMLNGVLDTAAFAPNPDGKNIEATLISVPDAREQATTSGNFDFFLVHGSTDYETVDMRVRSGALVANDIAYGDNTAYSTLTAGDYVLDMYDAAGTGVIKSFKALWSGYGDSTGVVFSTGHKSIPANQNGKPFAWYCAYNTGTVVRLFEDVSSRLQIVHNAADTSLTLVDVYINGVLAHDDFAFRTATPFSDISSGSVTNIGIAPPTSTSVNDTLISFDYTFTAAKKYVLFVNGVANTANFTANPSGKNIAINTYTINDGREAGSDPAKFDVNIFHGVTDAPAVDVSLRNTNTILADSATYGDFTGYTTIDTANYVADVYPHNSTTILKSYRADLLPMGGQSGIIFASGFLDSTAANQTNAPFGLYMVFPAGYVIPLTEASEARIQVIHNCADPAADSVDVYVNGFLLVDNFPFRTATPFISIGAGVTYNVGIAPKNSTSVNDTIRNFAASLENGKTYIAIASGVVSPASFAANPDGRAIDFNVWLTSGVRETATLPANFDFITIHGITDAPTVDLIARNVMTLNDNIAYSDISPYSTLPGGQYLFDVTDATNTTTFSTFNADLAPLAGKAGVVFGSGFVDPSQNQNGVLYGLWVAMPDGSTFPLPQVTAINETLDNGTFTMYPNPVSDYLTITLNNNQKNVQVQIMNNLGQVVLSQKNNFGTNAVSINIAKLPAGVYTVQLISENDIVATKIVKQ